MVLLKKIINGDSIKNLFKFSKVKYKNQILLEDFLNDNINLLLLILDNFYRIILL